MAASDGQFPGPPPGADRVGPPVPRKDGAAGTLEPRPSRLWIWFVAAFALQFAAWAVWLTIASQHRVQEVPVAPAR